MLGILVEEAGQAEAEKMMSSFGPVVALANLGSTLQNTFAAGNRVLDIFQMYQFLFQREALSEFQEEAEAVNQHFLSFL